MLPYFGKVSPNLKKINKLNGEKRASNKRKAEKLQIQKS